MALETEGSMLGGGDGESVEPRITADRSASTDGANPEVRVNRNTAKHIHGDNDAADFRLAHALEWCNKLDKERNA